MPFQIDWITSSTKEQAMTTIASGMTWVQDHDRDNFGNRDYIRVKYEDTEQSLYCWGYYKSLADLNNNIGSQIHGSKAVLQDQIKHFIPFGHS